jgi:hypothetical protein
MDFIGVTRTIDQAVYMLLNALAIVLWRIDSAIIGMSLYSYATQDWLTGNGGGVWYIMDWLLDTSGLFGLNTWTLFAGLALMLWGLSRIARPFIPSSPVHPGKLLVFFVLSYVVISQGSALMQDIESWRLDAGSAVYESVAGSSSPSINVPSVPSTSDPLAPPADLDGQSPIRGWEAVATSYFLANSADDIHQPYPPEAFLVAYCLYNPDLPIEEQTTENAQGCSPRNAWDEWDVIDLSILQDVLGINVADIETAFEGFLSLLLGEVDLDLTVPVPSIQHHPENRELGIRQAQAGVARLALGAIVALFPIIEANISLMLALAASFIYLALPIIILFGFFLATESLTNRLLMQFVAVIIRTLIINGIVALFMLLLMNTALSGSLTAYLGLVGVGLVGGFFLARVAAATMKETLSQSMGALGAVWMGTSTGLLGKSAAQPARATLGMAKMGAAAALLGAGGAMSFLDLAETGYEGFRSGAGDLRQGAPGTMSYVDRQTARLPASLSRLAQSGLGSEGAGDRRTAGDAPELDPLTSLAMGVAAPLAVGALAASSRSRSTSNGQAGGSDETQTYQPGQNGQPARRWGAAAGAVSPALAPAITVRDGHRLRQQRQADVDQWVNQMYRARQAGRGQKQAGESGRDLLGEDLAWKVERAIGRHGPAEVQAVLDTARQVAGERERTELVGHGRLTGAALTAVRDKLDADTAHAFAGQKGAWDLAALTAVALQQHAAASPEEFRRAMAQAESGWGQDSPGHKVPRALGLDPVAAGAHYTAMNRFSRLSEEAGLTPAQRERLLAEAQTGQISDELRVEVETSLQKQRKQGQGLTTEAIIAGALAMPATLSGPEQVWTTPAKSARQADQVEGQAKRDQKQSPGERVKPGRVPQPAANQTQPSSRASRRLDRARRGLNSTKSQAKGAQPEGIGLGQRLKSSLQGQTPGRAETKPDPVTTAPQPAKKRARPAPQVGATAQPIANKPKEQQAGPPVTGGRVNQLSTMAGQKGELSATARPEGVGLGKALKSSLSDQRPIQAEAPAGQPVDPPPGSQPASPATTSTPATPPPTGQPEAAPVNNTETSSSQPSSAEADLAEPWQSQPASPAMRSPVSPPLTGQPANAPVGRAEPLDTPDSARMGNAASWASQPAAAAPNMPASPFPTGQPVSPTTSPPAPPPAGQPIRVLAGRAEPPDKPPAPAAMSATTPPPPVRPPVSRVESPAPAMNEPETWRPGGQAASPPPRNQPPPVMRRATTRPPAENEPGQATAQSPARTRPKTDKTDIEAKEGR